ncbi:MAG: beta strand repeat-containing protein [Patescibacteria group bacterium]
MLFRTNKQISPAIIFSLIAGVFVGVFFVSLPVEAYFGNNPAVTYTKGTSGTLTAEEWNLVKNDFVNTWGAAQMTGGLGIGTAADVNDILATGTIKTNNSFIGNLSATYMSAGSFGANTGGGNYSFPSMLGIGTTTPRVKLEILGTSIGLPVVGTDQTNGLLRLSNNSQAYVLDFGVYNGGSWIQSTHSGNLSIAYNLLLNPNGGNVGIGTNNPTVPIEIVTSNTNVAKFNGSGLYSGFRVNASAGAGNAPYVALDSAGVQKAFFAYDLAGTGITSIGTGINTSVISIINSSGNVGVGTTNPGRALDVQAGAAEIQIKSTSGTNSSLLRLNNTGGDLFFGRETSSGGSLATGAAAYAGIISASGNYPLQLATNANVRLTVNNSGNIGIGTTSPASLLDVNGVIKMRGTLIIAGEDVINKNYLDSALASTTGTIVTQIATSSLWQGSLVGDVYNNNTGNIGIGTTSPAYKLDVVGDMRVKGNAYFDYATFIKDDNYSNGVDSWWGWYAWEKEFQFNKRSAANAWLQNVWTANWDTGDLALVPTTGNVGIGTTTPDKKLHVAGDIHVGGVGSGIYFDTTGSVAGASIIMTDYAMTFLQNRGAQSRLILDDGIIKLGVGAAAKGIYINSTSNVGIGTTSPTTAQLVIATSTTSYSLDVGNYRIGNVGTPIFNTDAVTKSYVDSSVASSSLWTASGTAIFSNNSGNVGIGTNNPNAKLELLSTTEQLRLDYSVAVNTKFTTNSSGNLFIVPSGKNVYLGDAQGTATTLNFYQGANGTAGNIANIRADYNNFFLGNPNGGVIIEYATTKAKSLQVQEGGAPYDRMYWWYDGTSLGSTGMNFESGAGAGSMKFKLGGGTTPNFRIIDKNSLALFTALEGGKIGIGTTSPTTAQLVIATSATSYSLDAGNYRVGNVGTPVFGSDVAIKSYVDGIVLPTSTAPIGTQSGFWTMGTSNNIYNINTGYVGIGTTTPATALHVIGTVTATNFSGNLTSLLNASNVSSGIFGFNSGFGNYAFSSKLSIGWGTGATSNPTDMGQAADLAIKNYLAIGATSTGGVALKVVGDTIITGSLQTQTGADFAEEFVTSEDLAPGTVVVMGDLGYKSVKPCAKENDLTVVGIVSDNPSIIAGRVESANKAIVAMMGVVKVKVTSANGKIKKGDLLTTSSISGYAMKSSPFFSGTVIGKALEDLVGKRGEIKVLVNLQ